MTQKFTAPIVFRYLRPKCRFCQRDVDVVFIEDQVDKYGKQSYFNPDTFAHQTCMDTFVRTVDAVTTGKSI